MFKFRSIRIKLLLLVGGIVLFMGGAAVTYFAILAPIGVIRQEREILSELSSRLKNLQVEVNRLLTAGVSTEQERFTAGVAQFQAAFDRIDKLTVLPSLNAGLEEALKIIKEVKNLSAESLGQVQEAYTQLIDKMKESGASLEAGPLNFNDLLGGDTGAIGGKVIGLMMFKKKIDGLDYILGVGETTIKDQFAVIDKEVSGTEQAAALSASTIVAFIVLLTVLAALLFSMTIARPIRHIEKTIGVLKSGDLRPRISVRSADEMGRLADNLNSLLDVLGDFHRNIQSASEQNLAMKQQLAKSVSETASSSVEIEVNTGSIKGQMEKMDGMTVAARDAVTTMHGAFSRFMERLDLQDQKVEDTVSGVTQMMASIENIVRITETDQHEAKALVSESEQGRHVFEAAFDRVAEINDSIDLIQEMARVIQGVASQTNLLAMNAAIEAAHAGEFGKGFAVVADEIRKLAETSNTSSREIAQTINTVTQKIREAADSRNSTSEAFNAISAKILVVTRSIMEIYSNVAEMQAGGKQILQAMADLKGKSGELTEESHRFETSTASLENTIGTLNRVSGEVVTNIDEITAGLKFIGNSVHQISDHANQVEEIGLKLDGQIKRFTV